MLLKEEGILTAEHTAGHVDCTVCIEAQRLRHQKLSPDLKFREAFDIWLAERSIPGPGGVTIAKYISDKTVQDYKVCAKALEKFFYAMRLGKIHSGHLVTYQNARATCDQAVAAWAKPAGANCIRKEIALLRRILREVGLWKEADDKSLILLRAEEMDVPRAATPEEQHRFLHLASNREDWQFVYCYAIIGIDTTCSAGEMRKLRLGDICLGDRVVMVRKGSAKNKYRIRTIPLGSKDSVWALEQLIERARSLGSTAPHHYLFPIQESKGTYDPNRPMSESGLKKRWDEVRAAAHMKWFKPNGLRHTAITRLAEAGVPIHVILARAGHVTLRMQQHYTSISLSSHRQWAEAAWSGSVPNQHLPPKKAPAIVREIKPRPVESAAPMGRRSLTWVGTTWGY